MNDVSLIAPCGLNCGLCLAYLRTKNHCHGCRGEDHGIPAYCRKCIIRNCELLSQTKSKFCYECEKYPCKRLKQLDKRYRTRYHVSLLENLEFIKNKGADKFLTVEKERWTCPECGATLCVHRGFCLNCKASRN